MKSGAPPDLAESLFGGDPAHRLALLKAAWPAAVGPDLARRSEVVALDREVLRVRVPDGIWRRGLWRMRSDLLGRLRQVAGRAAPRGLGFVEGPVRAGEDPPAEAAPPPPLEALPPVIADAAGSIADPELRERFETAASRYLGRFGGTDAQDEDESTSG